MVIQSLEAQGGSSLPFFSSLRFGFEVVPFSSFAKKKGEIGNEKTGGEKN